MLLGMKVYGIGALAVLATQCFGQISGDQLTEGEARSRAFDAYNSDNHKACAEFFELTVSLTTGDRVINDAYNAACCHALSGNVEKAFEMLERSIKAGYKNLNHVKGDTDLISLHDDPRWKPLLATIVVPEIRLTRNITRDPAKAEFIYVDVENFIRAMKQVKPGEDPSDVLQREYLDRASPGLKMYIEKYGLPLESLVESIEERPAKYAQLGERLSQFRSRAGEIREAIAKYKEVVPQVVIPPTYFVVANYSGVASGSPEGQLITLERRTEESINGIETLILHELTHFQQVVAAGPDEFYALFGDKKSLLGLAIREGAAEFFAHRVTGEITQQDALEYVMANEADVWRRFEPVMLGRDTSEWMWSAPSHPDQPRDVGYALGSRIVEAYYDQASDKDQAVAEILGVVDYPAFLEASGYATRFSGTSGSP